MDLVLHTRCIEPSSDFKILTDSSTLDIQTKQRQGDIKKAFENSKKDFKKMFLNPLRLNPDIGVQPYTSRTFNTVILNPDATNNIEAAEKSYTGPEITLDSSEPNTYPLLPLSYELVLPNIVSEELSFDKLLKCVRDEGESQVLTPSQYLERLKRTIAMLQKVIYAKTTRIPGTKFDINSLGVTDNSIELVISIQQTIDQLVANINIAEINEDNLTDDYSDPNVRENAFLESIRSLFGDN